MASRSQRILLWSILGVVGVGFFLLVVFGEIFQCQRTAPPPHLQPPQVGDAVQLKPGISSLLKTSTGEIELPPGSLLEVTGVREGVAEVKLVSDGTAGELAWNDGSRGFLERAAGGLVELYAKDTWTALEALELADPLGRGWSHDAIAYAAASGDQPAGGGSREWVVAFYSNGLKRILSVALTAGAQPAVQEDSPPDSPAGDFTSWPLGSARLALGRPAVDSPAALEAATASDDRRETEKSRWELFRIYLVHQGDPENLGDPWLNNVTYRVFQRLAVRMNPDDEAAFTEFVVDAQTGVVLTRLP
ncbi:MAG: hypothetical protein NTW26_04375 [bacterium]|nr:hypothetical protein [bacterium]